MEITILQFIAQMRSELATIVACIFSLFGESLFLVALICLIYWVVDKKLGERLVFVSFSSMPVNGGLKGLVARPRPYTTGLVSRVEVDNPLISTMSLDPYASFPSGHSQMSAGLFVSTACHIRKKWAAILFVVLTVGVMCSRLYLGVHYPTDVLVGAILGTLFALFWDWMYRKHESKVSLVFALFALLSIGLAFLFPDDKSQIELCACAVGAAICIPLEHKFVKFENAKSGKARLLRLLVGFVCVGIVFGGFSLLPFEFLEGLEWKFAKYFLTITAATLVAPALFKKLKI